MEILDSFDKGFSDYIVFPLVITILICLLIWGRIYDRIHWGEQYSNSKPLI